MGAKRHGERVGLDSFLVVLINNGDSVLFGKTTGASSSEITGDRIVHNVRQGDTLYDIANRTEQMLLGVFGEASPGTVFSGASLRTDSSTLFRSTVTVAVE